MSELATRNPASALEHTALVSALTTVLERRYLETFDAARFRLVSEDDSNAVPILCEVTGLGRHAKDESLALAVPQLLAACHNPGHDFVVTVLGDGGRHRLHYGLRRRSGADSFQGAIVGLKGAFRAQVPGLELSDPRPMRLGIQDGVTHFIGEAKALASITGIPSPTALHRTRQPLDQLIAAMHRQRYVLMIVGEALPIDVVEDAISMCRTLMSELHPAITASLSQSQSQTDTETWQRSIAGGREAELTPALLQAITYAAGAGGLMPFVALASILARPDGELTVGSSESGSASRSITDGRTLNLLNADARHCYQLIEAHHQRLSGARSGGWWRSAVYVATESEDTLHLATQALRGALIGDGRQMEPIRIQRPPAYQLREAMQNGRLLNLVAREGAGRHPLGVAHEALATCINGEEMAALVAPPQADAPGISIRERAHFAQSVPSVNAPAIRLGRLVGASEQPVEISARALNEHVLVVGTPGSGKTNTSMRLLIEAYQQFGTPFLVIEPAKAEYRRLAAHPSLAGKLQVFSIGGEGGSPLRLNPLRPVPGVPLLGHIDLLKAVFNAAFSMFPGMPQILEQALIEVYEQRGWNVYLSQNEALKGARHRPEEVAILLPTLGDLQQQVDRVLRRRDYGDDVRRNIGAALTSRINGLCLGAKGLVLDTRYSTSLQDLFERPAVLELNNLRDDEEKSFIMALVLALLNQYCEARQVQLPAERHNTLQHITLIEEAHRLLSASPRQGAEAADARGKGVSIFTDMLSELRALGEGFIVAEQIPTKLAPDVLKNTNMKIIHRLTAPADCIAVGDSVNLSREQQRELVSLPTGMAVLHGLTSMSGEMVAEAALIRITSAKDDLGAPSKFWTARVDKTREVALGRLGGCASCNAPCTFYSSVRSAIQSPAATDEFRAFAEALMLGRFAELPERFSAWRLRLPKRLATPTGETHCLFIHAADRWLQQVLAARGIEGEDGRRPVALDLLAADRLSQIFGTLATQMLNDVVDIGTDQSIPQALQTALAAILESSTNRGGLVACGFCPAPCVALPFVATRLSAMPNSTVTNPSPHGGLDKFGREASVDLRFDRIVKALDATTGPELDLANTGLRSIYRYCAFAHLPTSGAQQTFQAEVLARLASTSS